MSNLTNSLGAIGPLLPGIATIALAVLTTVVIIFNRKLLRANRASVAAARAAAKAAQEAVQAANREAEATNEAASTTKLLGDAAREQVEAMKKQVVATVATMNEMILTREMHWRPVLVWKNLSRFPASEPQAEAIKVENLGRGAAIKCLYVSSYQESLDWYQGSLDWRKTEVFDLRAGAHQTPLAHRQTQPLPSGSLFEGAETRLRELIFCQDEFGNVHRFLFPKPEVWRGGDPEPLWVRLYRRLIAPS